MAIVAPAALRSTAEALQRTVGATTPTLFDSRHWAGRLLRVMVADEGLRTALFQIVDVLPDLCEPESIAAHMRSYLRPPAERLGGPWRLLPAAGAMPWAGRFLSGRVAALARLFMAEEAGPGLMRTLTELRKLSAAWSIDAVGEAVLSEVEADAYAARYQALLATLAGMPDDLRGPTPPHLSIKLSGLTADFDPLAEERVRDRVLARIGPIVNRLAACGGGLTVDMEQYADKVLVLRIFRSIVEAWPDPNWLPGIALQAYLPDTTDDLHALIRWARQIRRRVAVRLVKGAYWDTEVAYAVQSGWPVPVYQQKAETDAHFEQLVELLFDHVETVQPAIATHNLHSLAYAVTAARSRGLHPELWEIQMLYGMAEPLRDAIIGQGLNVRVYLPVGDLIQGIAYLIRRLMENTANTSVLRHAYLEHASLDELLAPAPCARQPARREIAFQNLPLRDFSKPATRENFQQELFSVRGEFDKAYPLRISGVRNESAEWLESVNPAAPSEKLGVVALANVRHAEQAVRNAVETFAAWRERSAETRIGLCRQAADLIEAKRNRLAAWQIFEVGKNWREADADVAEAADYFRYYALQMEALLGWQTTACFPAETNHLRYEPRGVAAIIAPWNFPLAILSGMTAAALAAGNVVIMKPASPAVLVAYQLRDLLLEAGFPPNVCQLLPGPGGTLGNHLVSHPDVHLIAFTGSREVGMGILRKAQEPALGQRHVKQVICELGGKNAVIVDDDADLDEAVRHILSSAFGYQGQKCSAASRVIAVGKVHDRLVERLSAALDSYDYGPPENPDFRFGPLISAGAVRRVQSYLAIGRREGRLYYLGRTPEPGHYHPPAIFTNIESHHRLAREEIFGPILAILRADDFRQAVAMALDSDYALTAGVFSRHPAHLELARRQLRVGNLYLNRGITGARVGIQPFGGTRLSGTGIQAGGPDYLKQFLWTRTVTENTQRHGFVPSN